LYTGGTGEPQSRGKYSNRSRCAVRINIISHRERSERNDAGERIPYFACELRSGRRTHARTHARRNERTNEISQPRLSISGDASISMTRTLGHPMSTTRQTKLLSCRLLANYAPYHVSRAALVPQNFTENIGCKI